MRTKVEKPHMHIVRIEAPFWRRLFAFMVDTSILVFLVLDPFISLMEKFLPKDKTMIQQYIASGGNTNVLAALLVIMGLFTMAYFALLEWQLQASIGKLFFGLRIESETGKPSFGQCLVRSLFALPVFPFIALWIIDPLLMLLLSSHQRLSEILSRTKTMHYAIFFYNNGMMEE